MTLFRVLSWKYLCLVSPCCLLSLALTKKLLIFAQPLDTSVSSSSGLSKTSGVKSSATHHMYTSHVHIRCQYTSSVTTTDTGVTTLSDIRIFFLPQFLLSSSLFFLPSILFHLLSPSLPSSPHLLPLPLTHHCTSSASFSSKSLQVDQLNLTRVG